MSEQPEIESNPEELQLALEKAKHKLTPEQAEILKEPASVRLARLNQQIGEMPTLYEWEYKGAQPGSQKKIVKIIYAVGGVVLLMFIVFLGTENMVDFLKSFFMWGLFIFIIAWLPIYLLNENLLDPDVHQKYRLTEIGIQCVETALTKEWGVFFVRCFIGIGLIVIMIVLVTLGPLAFVGVGAGALGLFGMMNIKSRLKPKIINCFFYEGGDMMIFYDEPQRELSLVPMWGTMRMADFGHIKECGRSDSFVFYEESDDKIYKSERGKPYYEEEHVDHNLDCSFGIALVPQNKQQAIDVLNALQPLARQKQMRLIYSNTFHPAYSDPNIPSELFPCEMPSTSTQLEKSEK